jgi:hypothetical protein
MPEFPATPKGADAREGAIDMARKVSPPRHEVAVPAPDMPMPGTAAPVANWPGPRGALGSGLAKRGSLGSMPSSKAPGR